MSQVVVESRRLVKVFRDFWGRPAVRAVDGLTFEVKAGEIFGLLGPNGSGKTTTMKLVLGLLRPTSGSLLVLGQSPRDVRTKARIGYLPEESYLYAFLTAEETLDFYGRLFDLPTRERKRRIEELLDMVGLHHARRRPVGEFSRGMARRIGLAQALINDPDLVVLDEPTAGLDPIGCRQVKDLIRMLGRRGKTVILSSHLLADVEDVCDRIVILYNGRLQAQGSIAELLEERRRVRVMLPSADPEVVSRLVDWVRSELSVEAEVDHPRMDLEQYFLQVIEQARAAAPQSTGASAGGPVASYLVGRAGPGAPEGRGDVEERLRHLVEPRPSEERQDAT